ncbi:MAG: 16S rRNA (adenine(1518)-N(6)/adenine(1519)-N(6))-dimethyltransferase RsmA [Candidatus Omnitrophica bacterium]|nr:16S rRNA (adenine(1518)-N(6)/adenine(1519)-N(6))-dimethyltransferase RsmA [Candidatus Omnitrophota bacterium]
MLPKPKKRLGQNFLLDKNIQKKIVACADVQPQDSVLEIGAGRGALTRLLAHKAHWVYAVEIDRDLCALLKDEFKAVPNVVVMPQDILALDLRKQFSLLERKLVVIGNIPYYITTPIIEHFFDFRDLIKDIFLTVQKEFACRMTAAAGDREYGAFSCFVQYHTEPKILFEIKKTSFYPAPKVDSCFLRLSVRRKPPVEVADEGLLFRIIRAGFQQRRKTLKNSLKPVIPQQTLEAFFSQYSIDPRIRAEKLTLQDFANLANLA